MKVLVAVALPLLVACGGSTASTSRSGPVAAPASAPAPGCAPGQPCEPHPSCAPGQACAAAASSAAPLGSVYTTDPSALAGILAAAAAAGSAILSHVSDASDPAEAGLREAAAKHAPGMSPEGPVAKGDLPEDGHVEFTIQMEPGKCYAVVAYGAGVTDLDVNLLAPPLYNFLAGQDGMTGPTAVVGADPRPLCPLLPVSVPYKVDLHAKKGSGAVAAQVYAKPK